MFLSNKIDVNMGKLYETKEVINNIKITLDDIPLRDFNINWLRSTIGVVQQEPIIFVATVAENIRMGDDSLTNEDVEEACRMANAQGFISKLSEVFF
uniref:ABC transporter domain-containing protein n=1 Tax=Heterorhabditis bacteriophora TaxID=37862 RepID=A0A1I7X167_HETBA